MTHLSKMLRIGLMLLVSVLPLVAGAEVASPPVETEAAVADIPRFDIAHYKVEGNALLDDIKIISILTPYTGLQLDFGEIQKAMEALEKEYHKLGYTMVTVILPEQELTKGEVRIRVIEPRVTEIKITGNEHFDTENILSTLPTLKSGEFPKINEISENLRVANENPARKITLNFKAQEKLDDLHAELKVKDQKPWKVNLTGDNTGSVATGRYRAGIGFQHFNLFNRDHIMSLQYTTSPGHVSDVKVASGSYRLPLYRLGDALDLFGSYSDVDSGTTQISGTNINVSGKGYTSGFRYNKSLPRFGEYEHKLIVGMDYRAYDNSAILLGSQLAADVVAHPLSLVYGGVLTTEPLVSDGSLGLLYNIPWGRKGEKADFEASRSNAAADYLIVRGSLNAMYRPGKDWILRVATNAQYTNDRLISGEQFGYGGSSVLRGFNEREESWDAGASGSFEIYSPDIAGLLKLPDTQFRLLGFFDAGGGYNLHPTAGESRGNSSLASAGAGLRFGYGEVLSFILDWGFALDSSTDTRRGDNAVHFKGQMSF